jgi:hypothetical protein
MRSEQLSTNATGAAMISNLERYKKDLASLQVLGDDLLNGLQLKCFPDEFRKEVKRQFGGKEKEAESFIKAIPSFDSTYQQWYSEAKALVKLLLPDRLSDFVRHYEKPKSRKEITYESYTIEDCLQGLNVTRGAYKDKIVGTDAAIPHFTQQLAMLKAVNARFESSLFDIHQLVQADVFDSELGAAEELAKNKFTRAAGALAGVVLERHLSQVCDNHSVKLTKKVPTISDLNDAMKDANVVDIPQWRFIQHLGDIRNLCDHSKKAEPTPEQVNDLVAGVMKITKTLF